MDSVLFNLHDIILLMTMLLSVVFAGVLLMSHRIGRFSAVMLAGFMLAHAFIAFHELTLYGVKFRLEVLSTAPDILFIGSLAYCVDAALLYFFVKSRVYKDFQISWRDIVHFLPLCFYFGYLALFYFSMSDVSKVQSLENWELLKTAHFITADSMVKLLRLVYILSSLALITKYHNSHKQIRADMSGIDLNWLKLLLCGFLVIMISEALLSLIKVVGYVSPVSSVVLIGIGVSGYYTTFFLLLTLLCYSFVRASTILPVLNEKVESVNDVDSGFKADYINRIEQHMLTSKPYLMSDITIDALSSDLTMSAKDLSVTLNRHFQVNFFEFINGYRITEAKRLLEAEEHKSITEILYEVGFNSKSVFYSFFKKVEGVTPTEYRNSRLQKA